MQGTFFKLVNTDSTVELFNLVAAMEAGATDPFEIELNGAKSFKVEGVDTVTN